MAVRAARQRILPRELFDAAPTHCLPRRSLDLDAIGDAEDNAGFMVLSATPARSVAAGIDLRARLTENDGYGVLAAPGDLVVAGPTHTKVNDFRAILIDRAEFQAGEV